MSGPEGWGTEDDTPEGPGEVPLGPGEVQHDCHLPTPHTAADHELYNTIWATAQARAARPQEWWCEAYGPPAEGVPAERWPRCFLTGDQARRCELEQVCADIMAGERARVFTRINQLAVDGGEHAEVYRYLADEIPTPGSMLGGPDTEEPR